MLAHPSWRFEEDRLYQGSVSIDGQLFSGEPVASAVNSLAIYISKECMHAFTAGQSMTIHHTSGVGIATISLDGTTRRVDTIVACSEAVQASSQQPFGAPKEYAMPKAPFAPATQARQFPGPQWES